MNNMDELDGKDKLHMQIVVQIWDKIAGLVYDRFKKEGRGVVVMFMLNDIPENLKDILPPIPVVSDPARYGTIATAYVPHSELLILEKIIGEQGVLKLDRQLLEYDPDTTIVFAFIETQENDDGSKGIVVSGFDVTPPSVFYPSKLYQMKKGLKSFFSLARDDGNNPLMNLN